MTVHFMKKLDGCYKLPPSLERVGGWSSTQSWLESWYEKVEPLARLDNFSYEKLGPLADTVSVKQYYVIYNTVTLSVHLLI